MLAAIWAFTQVVLIDLALSADNAVVIGLAVHALPESERKRATFYGIGAAVAMRIVFALMANGLMQYSGIRIFGGLALGYVAYKMLRELLGEKDEREHPQHKHEHKTLRAAVWQIAVADLSMSLDNVLAVAGAADKNPGVMVFGLVLSVALMAFGAQLVAKIIDRHWWVSWAALAVIALTSLHMLWSAFWAVA